jgi:hypothetical protein
MKVANFKKKNWIADHVEDFNGWIEMRFIFEVFNVADEGVNHVYTQLRTNRSPWAPNPCSIAN